MEKDKDKTTWEKLVGKFDWIIIIIALLLLVWFIWALFMRPPENTNHGVTLLDKAVPACVKDSRPQPSRQKYHYNNYDFYFYQTGCLTIDFGVINHDLLETVDSSEAEYTKAGFNIMPIKQFAVLVVPGSKSEVLGTPGYSRAAILGVEQAKYNFNKIFATTVVDDNLPKLKPEAKQNVTAAVFYHFSGVPLPAGANSEVRKMYAMLRAKDFKAFQDYVNKL